MRHLRLSFIALLVLSLACDLNSPFSNSPTSTVSMAVAFPNGENTASDGSLDKAMTIVTVSVRIFADDMDDVVANLEMNQARDRASGSVEVPKGDDRTFHVTLVDENQVRQYEGEEVFDIVDDDESIQMDVFGIRPDAANLIIGRVTSMSVLLLWTQSQANDFAEYMIIRTETPDISLNFEVVRRIFNREKISYIDSTVQQDQNYYYAVLALDTEGLFNLGPVRGIHTARLHEIAYHDDWFEDYHWGDEQGDRCEVEFQSPNYPCFVRAIKLRLRDESGFDDHYRVYVEDKATGNVLFYSDPLPTDPATATEFGGWVTWRFLWDNRAQGTVNGDFYAGIEYETAFGWPDLFIDNSSNQERSFFYDAGGDMWYDAGGNYLMNIEVEIGGGTLGKGAPASTEAHDRLIHNIALARAGGISPSPGRPALVVNWANPDASVRETAARSPRSR
ncbi:hypothetical protein ACFL45_10360 [Candidatus Neomarinimicrobiota bacterium]